MTEKPNPMSYWNHRVVRRVEPTGEIAYAIHETHYNSQDNVMDMSDEPVLYGIVFEDQDNPAEAVRDLREQLERMLECLDKPVINYDGPYSPGYS